MPDTKEKRAYLDHVLSVTERLKPETREALAAVRNFADQLENFPQHRARMTTAEKSAFITQHGYEKFMSLPD